MAPADNVVVAHKVRVRTKSSITLYYRVGTRGHIRRRIALVRIIIITIMYYIRPRLGDPTDLRLFRRRKYYECAGENKITISAACVCALRVYIYNNNTV
jgi:hypothetical protein